MQFLLIDAAKTQTTEASEGQNKNYSCPRGSKPQTTSASEGQNKNYSYPRVKTQSTSASEG